METNPALLALCDRWLPIIKDHKCGALLFELVFVWTRRRLNKQSMCLWFEHSWIVTVICMRTSFQTLYPTSPMYRAFSHQKDYLAYVCAKYICTQYGSAYFREEVPERKGLLYNQTYIDTGKIIKPFFLDYRTYKPTVIQSWLSGPVWIQDLTMHGTAVPCTWVPRFWPSTEGHSCNSLFVSGCGSTNFDAVWRCDSIQSHASNYS